MRRSTVLVLCAFAAAFLVPLALAFHFLVWTAWRAELASPVAAGPLLVSDLVLVGLADGALVAFAAEDGAERWRAQCGAPLAPSSPLAASAGSVACAAGSRVSAFDAATGAVRFSRDLGPSVSTPWIDGEQLLVAQGDGVHALALADGAPRWSRAPWPGRDVAALRSDGGALIAVGAAGVAALDPTRGATLWQIDVGAPIVAAPELAGDLVFVLDAGAPPRVHALTRDGVLLWSGAGETVPVPLGAEAVDASGETLRARDARTGQPHWEKMGFAGPWSAAPVRAGARVVVGFEHMLHAFALGGSASFSTIRHGAVGPRLAGDDARVYYVEDATTLVALDAD